MDIDMFFQSLADCLAKADFQSMAAAYVHPLVIYAPDGIRIEKSMDETVLALGQRLMTLRAAGVATMRTQVEATDLPSSGRHPYDVTWIFLDSNGNPIGESRIRYFCRSRNGDTPLIELMDIIHAFRSTADTAVAAASH